LNPEKSEESSLNGEVRNAQRKTLISTQ